MRRITAKQLDIENMTISGSLVVSGSAVGAFTGSFNAEAGGNVSLSHSSGSIRYIASHQVYVAGLYGVSEDLEEIDATKYSAVLVEYIAERSDAIRAGMFMATWKGVDFKYTDISTMDIGDTSDVQLKVTKSGDVVKFRVTSMGIGMGTWSLQYVFKLFPKLA